MTNADFDAHDVRHAVSSAFNVIALLESPEAMRRASAEKSMSELRGDLCDIVGDAIGILKDHRFRADRTAAALLEVLSALHAALERWTEDGEPPSDLVEQARECHRRFGEARIPHGWPVSARFAESGSG
jgi:hypothetical protein